MNETNKNSLKYYLSPKKTSKKTLVLDLDETLVHSQFVPFSIKSDLIFKIELDNQLHDIHVLIRPGVPQFLKKMAKLYEIVIFTASISKYADPLLNIIDRNHICSFRLFREHCSMVGVTYIKDLKKLGRELKDIIIVDNSPLSYSFNPENGLPILTWFDDKNDKELYKITPILEFLSSVYDVRDYIKQIVVNNSISYDSAINVIDNYSKINDDDSYKKYIEEIVFNKTNYIDNNINENNNSINNENINILNNCTLEKKDKKNNVNITISNNAINNFLYFSPIYNINNNQINNNTNNGNLNMNKNKNIMIGIKKKPKNKLIEKMLLTKTNRTKSKGLLSKINININKRPIIKNKSNNYKKIKYNYNNINNNLKDKLNSIGNKTFCTDINNNKLNYNLNISKIDLKTKVPSKKNALVKDFKLPKTPEIEEILYPLHERMPNNINNKKVFAIINKKIIQTNRKGNSTDKNRNNNYQFRNSLYYKYNNQLKSNIISHEKHKSFNYVTPYHYENNSIPLKNDHSNNYELFKVGQNQSFKNKSHSNHKYITTIKRNKTNNKTISLNLLNKNYMSLNECNNKQSKNSNKSKKHLININNNKAINNKFKIIGVTEFNKANKINKLINYNLIIQNSNSNTTKNKNYKKINSINRTISTDNSYNNSFNNYNNSLYSSNFRTINNNLNLNRTNQLIGHKKNLNNTIFKNSLIKYKTNKKTFQNYDNIISHKKTLSYNNGEFVYKKTMRRTNSFSLSKNQNILKDKKNIHKEIYVNNNNTINQKNKNTIKSTKREIKDIIHRNINNKIARIKEIKYINSNINNLQNNNNNNTEINNNNISHLINNNNFNRLKKSVNKNI